VAALEQVGAVVLEPDGTFRVLEDAPRDRPSALADVPGTADVHAP
jgi:hypothetical protein